MFYLHVHHVLHSILKAPRRRTASKRNDCRTVAIAWPSLARSRNNLRNVHLSSWLRSYFHIVLSYLISFDLSIKPNLFCPLNRRIMTLFTLYCLLLMVALPLQAHMSCYYPDGTYQPTDRPCNSNGTEESFCCGPGVTCLSDKVCDNFGYVRGSCTDQSFKSSACPNFCLSTYFWCI